MVGSCPKQIQGAGSLLPALKDRLVPGQACRSHHGEALSPLFTPAPAPGGHRVRHKAAALEMTVESSKAIHYFL